MLAEQLRVRFLGAVDLASPSGECQAFVLRQPKRTALLAYIAASTSFVRRDQLGVVFWPERDTAHVRAALRQSLRYLRRALGDDVILNRGSEEVAFGSGVWCDIRAFHEHVRQGRPSSALELYRGDFLEGFHVDGSNEFQDWLEAYRAQVRQSAAEAAWTLAGQAEERASPTEAAFWGKRALSLSPFDEQEVHRLMVLLGRVGDRSGALRAFRGLERSMEREFGARPTAETEALARRLIDGTIGGPPVEVPGSRRASGDRRTGRGRRVLYLPGFTPERRNGLDRRAGPDRRTGRDRRA